jgi:hypothetical protein
VSAAASTQLATFPGLLDAITSAMQMSQPCDSQLLSDEQSLVHPLSRLGQPWRDLFEKPCRILFLPSEKLCEREAQFRSDLMAEDPLSEFADRANALKWLLRACMQAKVPLSGQVK